MNRWLRRLLYFFVVVVWLAVMSFPLVAAILAVRGEIQLGDDPRSHLRLFLVQERQAQGVGVEWTRPVSKRASCSQSSVSYLLWEGEAENVVYCQCYDEGGAVTSTVRHACDAP